MRPRANQFLRPRLKKMLASHLQKQNWEWNKKELGIEWKVTVEVTGKESMEETGQVTLLVSTQFLHIHSQFLPGLFQFLPKIFPVS